MHGLIFVIDSAAAARLDEVVEVFAEAVAEPLAAGKPVLIFANKQDLPAAWAPAELATRLGLHLLRDCESSIVACTALPPSVDAAGDPSIPRGVRWLIDAVGHDWSDLSTRVAADTQRQKEKHEAEIQATLARVKARREQEEREEAERLARDGLDPQAIAAAAAAEAARIENEHARAQLQQHEKEQEARQAREQAEAAKLAKSASKAGSAVPAEAPVAIAAAASTPPPSDSASPTALADESPASAANSNDKAARRQQVTSALASIDAQHDAHARHPFAKSVFKPTKASTTPRGAVVSAADEQSSLPANAVAATVPVLVADAPLAPADTAAPNSAADAEVLVPHAVPESQQESNDQKDAAVAAAASRSKKLKEIDAAYDPEQAHSRHPFASVFKSPAKSPRSPAVAVASTVSLHTSSDTSNGTAAAVSADVVLSNQRAEVEFSESQLSARSNASSYHASGGANAMTHSQQI